MDLATLLSELRENILNDRSDRVAGSSDYLWTDTTLIRYINEAQNRFARKGLVLRDGTTPEVTQVTLEQGVSEYPLHTAVIAVISAKLDGNAQDLTRVGHAILDAYVLPDEGAFNVNQLSTLSPGTPIAYTTDEYLADDDDLSLSRVSLRVYPTPDADAAGTNVLLRVVRMPIEQLSDNDTCAIPEIPSAHHLEMLDWAAYLALRIVDIDAGMPDRAKQFRQSFEAHVLEARQHAMRKLFAPVKWGFGKTGFTWDQGHG